MKWQDISSFSQGDKVRTPRTFELRLSDFRIVISRHIDYPPDVWVMYCEPFTRGREVSKGTANEAMQLAEAYVYTRLKNAVNDMEFDIPK